MVDTQSDRRFPVLRVVPPARRGDHITVPAGGPDHGTPTELIVDECPACSSQLLVHPTRYNADKPHACPRCGPQRDAKQPTEEEIAAALEKLQKRMQP